MLSRGEHVRWTWEGVLCCAASREGSAAGTLARRFFLRTWLMKGCRDAVVRSTMDLRLGSISGTPAVACALQSASVSVLPGSASLSGCGLGVELSAAQVSGLRPDP